MKARNYYFLLSLAVLFTGFSCNQGVITSVPEEPNEGFETPEPNRIYFCNRNWYLFGINYPWNNYGHDFGSNAWGHNGVSEEYTTVYLDFDELMGAGIRSVRWFLFADGRASPEFDSNGFVTGFDPFFYSDMDAALDIAKKHGIYIIFSLFDFYLCDTMKMSGGVQMGGHSDLISDLSKRQSFLDNALKPMLQRYASHPNVLAWEVMNEPEWVMVVDGGGNVGVPVTLDEMQKLTVEIGLAVKENAPDQLVTVGCASKKWIDLWRGVEMDFYQIHYYDWMEPWYPFDVNFDSLGLDKPCIIGEFPTSSSNITVDTYLEKIWTNNYAGSFSWSYKAGDAFSEFSSQPYMDWRQTYPNAPAEMNCP